MERMAAGAVVDIDLVILVACIPRKRLLVPSICSLPDSNFASAPNQRHPVIMAFFNSSKPRKDQKSSDDDVSTRDTNRR
jgi:hypothetical protein